MAGHVLGGPVLRDDVVYDLLPAAREQPEDFVLAHAGLDAVGAGFDTYIGQPAAERPFQEEGPLKDSLPAQGEANLFGGEPVRLQMQLSIAGGEWGRRSLELEQDP